MAKFIKLTFLEEKVPISINVDHIVSYHPYDKKKARIRLSVQEKEIPFSITVHESYEDVDLLILEAVSL